MKQGAKYGQLRDVTAFDRLAVLEYNCFDDFCSGCISRLEIWQVQARTATHHAITEIKAPRLVDSGKQCLRPGGHRYKHKGAGFPPKRERPP
jgi:hypothetical protein